MVQIEHPIDMYIGNEVNRNFIIYIISIYDIFMFQVVLSSLPSEVSGIKSRLLWRTFYVSPRSWGSNTVSILAHHYVLKKPVLMLQIIDSQLYIVN